MARQRWQGLNPRQKKEAAQLAEAGWNVQEVADHFFCIEEAVAEFFQDDSEPEAPPEPDPKPKKAPAKKATARAKTKRAGSPDGNEQD